MPLERRNFLHNHDHLQQSEGHGHVVVDRADWEVARRIFYSAGSEEDARAKLEEKLQEPLVAYEFCVVLSDDINDDMAEKLISSGCGDGTVVWRDGRTHVRFSRESRSLEKAILSAVTDVQNAGCKVDHVKIEPNYTA